MLSIEEQRQGITSNFSETMEEIRVERNIWSTGRKPHQARILYSVELTFTNEGEIKRNKNSFLRQIKIKRTCGQ